LRGQELFKLGILYDVYEDEDQDVTLSTLIVPQDAFLPTFRTRANKQTKNRQQQTGLPSLLSSSLLSENADISKLLSKPSASASILSTSAIQQRNKIKSKTITDVPRQSLPLTSMALALAQDNEAFPYPSLLFPSSTTFNDNDYFQSDEQDSELAWSIISSTPSTPASEPETWILLSDDS